MVLLHTSWVFTGLPGIVTLLTIIIVISGFAGRYLYTAIPRTADGIVMEADETENKIAEIETQLKAWQSAHPPSPPALTRGLQPEAASLGLQAAGANLLTRTTGNARAAWGAVKHSFSARERAQYHYLETLEQQRDAPCAASWAHWPPNGACSASGIFCTSPSGWVCSSRLSSTFFQQSILPCWRAEQLCKINYRAGWSPAHRWQYLPACAPQIHRFAWGCLAH